MPYYPTSAEFEKLLRTTNIEEVLYKHVLEGFPYAFRDSETAYTKLRQHLSTVLEVPLRDLTIVGSGRIGFSLDPVQFGRPFSDTSDLDVVVVSAPLFDSTWMEFILPKYRDYNLTNREQRRLKEHKKYIYWGNIRPDWLPGATQISRKWLEAFRGLAKYPEFARRDVNGWLFRSWWHVHLYYSRSLKQLANQLKIRELQRFQEDKDEI
jgi:hypothetical protein